MSVNTREEIFREVELFGKPAFFSNSRIDRDTVPEQWFGYDLRGSDYAPGRRAAVETFLENSTCAQPFSRVFSFSGAAPGEGQH